MQYPSPSSSHASRLSIPCSLSSVESTVPDDSAATQPRIQDSFWGQQEGGTNPGTVQNAPPSAELDFNLIWPDSEEFFETLMSLDSTAQWQVPLPTLPISNRSHSSGNAAFGTASSFHDSGSSIGAIPSGESHQAVHNVSEMVTALVSSL
jgi:hypothetical protein